MKLTIAVAEWPGAQPTIEALSEIATTIEKLEPAPPCLNRTLCVAPTLDAEVSEIARRIVQAHDNGRPWREMGVLLRSEATYVPALRSAFAAIRHSVAILFLRSPLADAPAVRYFRRSSMRCFSAAGITSRRCARCGSPGRAWKPAAPGDRFEHEVLKHAPGSWIRSDCGVRRRESFSRCLTNSNH